MPSSRFISHLDQPADRIPGSSTKVRGWIVATSPISDLSVRSADDQKAISAEDRPDVKAAHPGFPHATGFVAIVPASILENGSAEICFRSGEDDLAFPLSIPEAAPPSDKASRLERIRPILREDLPCRETPFHFDYLTPEVRVKFHVEDTDKVSEFAHAPLVQELIGKVGDGLVLDCGAGRRDHCLPNVVNLEIVAYPSTDVLATNEQLPFKDGSFDLVISCAVLEHVRYPFDAAKEIIRVTKPGGLIYADVPFLQPYHGYPSHYYNMTHQGLANLFEGACTIEQSFVPRYGLPIWSLSWFLNSYVAGLPDEQREVFKAMRVSDLLDSPMAYLEKPFVAGLSAEKNRELASVTSVLARKGPEAAGKAPGGLLGLFRRKG